MKRKDVLIALLKGLIAGVETSALGKIVTTFIAELASMSEDKEEALEALPEEDFNELLTQSRMATTNAAEAAVGAKQNKALIEELIGKVDEVINSHVRKSERLQIHNLPYKSIGGLFKGREEALGKLEEELGGGKVAAITQTRAICGLGGIGKTRLVVEFGWRLLEKEEVKAVLFVVADNLVNLTLNMAKLAGVGLLNLEERKLEDQLAVVEAVVGHLAGRDDYLMIFDNVDDEEARRRVGEIVPRLCKGRVIITSRMGQWSGGVKAVAIDKLSEEEAVSYLLEKTQGERAAGEDDKEAAGRLAGKLDGLPIALEQAAAYINHRHIGFREYLVEFDKGRKKVLSWHSNKLQDYPEAVLSVWQTTEERLGAGELGILRLASFLGPEAIPAGLFESGGERIGEAIGLIGGGGDVDGEIDVRGMLGELGAWSMINLAGERFIVHRLVQESVRLRIEKDYAKWVELALRLVSDYIPDDPPPDDVQSWGLWEAMAPHVSVVAEYGDESGIGEPTGRLMNKLALHFESKASFEIAERLYRRALAIDEGSFGAGHPNVAIDLNNLAQLLADTNRLDEAEPLMRRVLVIVLEFTQRVGHRHPHLEAAIENYSGLLTKMGYSEDEVMERLKGLGPEMFE